MLTVERLHEVLHYDPETGAFTWLCDTGGKAHAGDTAGWANAKGYREVEIDQRSYKAHRIAWLYMTGVWPKHLIDHEDTDKSNNAWRNLREATTAQNAQNRQGANANNILGILGVRASGLRYEARIRLDGKLIRLGSFATVDQAREARREAEKALFTHAP